MHFVIYKAFVSYFASHIFISPLLVIIIRSLFVVLSLSFIASFFIVYNTYSFIGRWLYRFAMIWLGTAWFLFVSGLLFSLLQFFNVASPVIGFVLIALSFSVALAAVINSFIIRIKTIEVTLTGLPESWKGKKIVLFADAHFGNIRGKDFARHLAKLIESRNPELVLISGDLYDGNPVPYEDMISPLALLADKTKVPHGVFYVTGNHEEFGDPQRFLNAIRKTGFRILNNESVSLEGITFLGVDYAMTEKKEEYKNILHEMVKVADMNQPSILLKHVPSNVDVATALGISLSVHGHTHKGQMWPFGLLAKRIFKEFYYGLTKSGDVHVITTSGVGTWGPPHRFFTQSEIVEIVLR